MFDNSSNVLINMPHKADEKILAAPTTTKPDDLEIHASVSHDTVEKAKLWHNLIIVLNCLSLQISAFFLKLANISRFSCENV